MCVSAQENKTRTGSLSPYARQAFQIRISLWISNPAKILSCPQYKKLLRKRKKTTCSISRAQIVWDATMKKSYSNGVFTQRTRALTLRFWICPCLIRAGEKTLWEHFSRILCFKCCPLWQKTSAPISDSGKQRVSRQQRRGVCALGDHHAPCRITFMLFIRGGVPGKLPAQQPQKECGMPLATFRYRAEIYEKAKLL